MKITWVFALFSMLILGLLGVRAAALLARGASYERKVQSRVNAIVVAQNDVMRQNYWVAPIDCLTSPSTCDPDFDGAPFLEDWDVTEVPGYRVRFYASKEPIPPDAEVRFAGSIRGFAYVAEPEPWAFWLPRRAICADVSSLGVGLYTMSQDLDDGGCLVAESRISVSEWPREAWESGQCVVGQCMVCDDACCTPARYGSLIDPPPLRRPRVDTKSRRRPFAGAIP